MAVEGRPYRLSPLAVSDLEDIWRYTAREWSPAQAETYHRDLMDAVDALARRLKTGRPVELREGYLKYAVGQHFIFYVQSDRSLDVIRILHRRMDVERRL